MRGGIGSATRFTGYRNEPEGTGTPRSGVGTSPTSWARSNDGGRLPAKERRRLFGQCRLALVHEQGSAFRRDLHKCLPGEATGPHVTVFPAAHGGERHPECVREVFLRKPGTLRSEERRVGKGRRMGVGGE